MDNKLTQDEIGHTTLISYVAGHAVETEWADFEAAIDNLYAAVPPVVTGTRRKFIIPEKVLFTETSPSLQPGNVWILSPELIANPILSNRPAYFGLPAPTPEQRASLAANLGFSASVPLIIIKDKSFEISLSGQAGKTWEVRARLDAGYADLYKVTGRFGDPEIEIYSNLETPPPAPVKEYGSEFMLLKGISFAELLPDVEWEFKYDGREVPNRFSPQVSQTLRTVGRPDPDPEPYHFLRTVSRIYASEAGFSENSYYRHGRFNPANNGVDQFHTLLFSPNQKATLYQSISIPALSKSTPGTLGFRIWPYCTGCSAPDLNGVRFDGDLDSLRFDLRFQNGNAIPHGTMNRFTGEFSIPYNQLPDASGFYTAWVTDGKGGTDSSTFFVQINP
ncbi:MAG TPA: hypothetical protein VJ385_04690 [Fibrobacteria bacterium]|nr:hypothetical protein [Fibrobacteria bacterium]